MERNTTHYGELRTITPPPPDVFKHFSNTLLKLLVGKSKNMSRDGDEMGELLEHHPVSLYVNRAALVVRRVLTGNVCNAACVSTGWSNETQSRWMSHVAEAPAAVTLRDVPSFTTPLHSDADHEKAGQVQQLVSEGAFW